MSTQFDRITIDPAICCGQPAIRGMRITVSIILRMVASGKKTEEILEAYPELEAEDIAQALKYAAWLASENTAHIFGREVRIA